MDVDLPEDLEEGKKSMAQEHDFSKGSIISNILKLALPMTLAQLINVLYNIIDRIYIGQLPEDATLPPHRSWAVSSHYFHRNSSLQLLNGRCTLMLH